MNAAQFTFPGNHSVWNTAKQCANTVPQKPLVIRMGCFRMEAGSNTMCADIVRRDGSECLLPGDFTATAVTKRSLRTPAAITIYFIREITCRWVIYRCPAAPNCALGTPPYPIQLHKERPGRLLRLFWDLEDRLQIRTWTLVGLQAGARLVLRTVWHITPNV